MISRYLPNTSSYQGRMVGSTGLWVTHSVMVHPQLKHNELPMSGALVGVESHNSSTYPSIHLEEWASWWVLVHSSVLSTGWPLDTAQRQTIHMIQQQCSKKPKSMDGALVAAGSQNSFIHPSIHPFIHPFIHLSIHPSIHSFIHPSMCTGWCEFVGSLCSLDRMTLEQSRETRSRMTQHSFVAGNQKQHMIWWHTTSRVDFDENRNHAILIKISKTNSVLLHSKRKLGVYVLSTYYYYYYY